MSMTSTLVCFVVLLPSCCYGDLKYAYYARQVGHIYVHGGNGIGLISSLSIPSKMECLKKCTNEPQCFNVNFKHGESCEMYGLADAGSYRTAADETLESFSMLSGSAPMVVMTTPAPDCESFGYIDVGVAGSCYYMDTTLRNVNDGLTACQSHSPPMSIVSFENEDEYNKIQLHSSYSSASWWNIGLNDIDSEMQYVWFNTGAQPIWTNWEPGNPSANTASNCIVMKQSTGRWYIVDCATTSLLAFTICEYNY
ncbi:unnamed protein product [Owenia fusiformis]|uniref:C-type lectin domain-containing protein n=1 Tax=Owenia fusiformis TaxID=6347 RepID=A0A8S4PUN6_OWEFU|nr:unnamed protein product [Owenia fusiformis]